MNVLGDARTKPSVCVVGLGYIGLPTASVLASRGYDVFGVDIRQDVVDSINEGNPHIEEAGLESLLRDVVNDGKLRAGLSPIVADIYIIAVPTPITEEKRADISYVLAAGRSIAPVVRDGAIVILESTSPVGTTEALMRTVWELRPDLKISSCSDQFPVEAIHFAYCPERIIPGNMLQELVGNDRIIGGVTPEGARRTAEFYRSFVEGECIETDAKTAEMVKLTENSFRDVNIAFANELSMVCDEVDVSVWEVIRLANRHPRVSILSPGAGVGGHCIAVDPWFLVERSPKRARLISTARKVNDSKPGFICDKVRHALESRPEAIVGCFGLAYKPDVDDFRESPALHIAKELSSTYPGQVVCVDPFEEAMNNQQRMGLTMRSMEEGAARADIVVVLVAHGMFRSANWKSDAIVVDAPGFFSN